MRKIDTELKDVNNKVIFTCGVPNSISHRLKPQYIITEAIRDNKSLRGLELSNVKFVNGDFNNLDFRDAKLINVVFTDCDLNNADFSRAVLKDCILDGNVLINTSFTGCKVSGLHITNSDISTINNDGIQEIQKLDN